MKVCYLTNIPAPYRVDFFNELGKVVDLTVLYERKTAADRDERWKRDNAKQFREVYLDGFKIGPSSAYARSVLQFIKDRSYDVRIIGGYSTPTQMLAIRFMKRHRIDYILSIDGGFPANECMLIKNLKRYFLSGAAMYLGTGKNAERYLAHYGADRKKIFHYHFTSLFARDILTVPPSLSEKKQLKEALGVRADKMVLSVGRLLPLKRYDLLIEAAKTLPETEVIIIGGETDAYHTRMLQQLGAKNVRFIDFMSYEALCRYYRGADVFVMPSDSDVWGMVIVEAMANGLPVIATESCGAASDLIRNGENGFIVPKGDKTKIYERLSFLLSSDEVRAQYGRNSLSFIREYTIENEVQDHIQAMDQFMFR